jgi:son of sevenless
VAFVQHETEAESDVARTLLSVVSANLAQEVSQQWLKLAPKPILPDMYHRNCFDFIDLHPVEVARQLTILEFQLFAAIEGKELLNQCWNAEDKEIQAPNVTLTISRFNQMSGWITTLMVKVKEMKPRVSLLKRFVDIAHECLKLNNFNSVVEIVSALGTTAVRRLTDTWDQLDPETKQTFQELKDLFETRKNWEHYRNRLASCTPPCIPYLGLYLTDLVMVDEVHKKSVTHPDSPETSLYNIERLVRISALHQEVKTFQAVRYCLKPVSYFQEYLMRLDQMSADECYNMSLEIQQKKKSAV